jgi:hypothetical protein
MESKLKYIMGGIQLFQSKMDLYLTASPSPFPCTENTWYVFADGNLCPNVYQPFESLQRDNPNPTIFVT